MVILLNDLLLFKVLDVRDAERLVYYFASHAGDRLEGGVKKSA